MLLPSVNRTTLRYHENSDVSPEYLRAKLIVFKRDNYTCQGCFFSVKPDEHFSIEQSKYLTAHPINNNHKDNSPDNLLTFCPFCHSLFHGGCLTNKVEMKVIFYPWLSQAQLNLIVNLLVSCRSNPTSKYIDTAKTLYEHFDAHFMYADSEKMFKQGMSSIVNFAPALMSLFYKSPKAYARRGELLAGLRFFPVESVFSEAAVVWANEWPDEDRWFEISKSWMLPEVNIAAARDVINE